MTLTLDIPPAAAHGRSKKFYVFNSFTDTAFCGNPAAVVPDADDLDPQTMQNIARQLNLIETVFILKAFGPEAAFRFRYFMPEKELPVAGHPTVAGWTYLAQAGVVDPAAQTRYVQETAAGNIVIEFRDGNVFTSQKNATVRVVDDFGAEEADIFGLLPDDLAGGLPVTAIDAGLGHIIFGVRSLAALMKLRCMPDRLGALCERYGMRESQIFCLEATQPELTGHTRNLCPRFGLEDPACGNGNAALGAYFSRFVFPDKTALHLRFEQGHIVNMPAIIEVLAGPGGIMIGGRARLMVEGRIGF